MTESQKGKSASNGKAEVLKILTENLTAGAKVAKRLLWSCERVAHLLPLDAKKVDQLTDEQEESFDALLLRFNSLTPVYRHSGQPAWSDASSASIEDGEAALS